MEYVLFIVGALVGLGIGWWVWSRTGMRRLRQTFERQLEQSDSQIGTQRARAEKAETELAAALASVKTEKDARKDVEKQLERQRSRFDKLKTEKSGLDESLSEATKRFKQMEALEAELEGSKKSQAALQAELEDLRASAGSVEDLRARLVSAQDRLVEAERAKEDARLRASEAEKVTERATVELDAAMGTISTLREAAESTVGLQRDLEAERKRIADLQAIIDDQESDLASLREQVASATVVAEDPQSIGIEPEDIAVDEPAPQPDPVESAVDGPSGDEPSEPVAPAETPATESDDPEQARESARVAVAAIAERTAGGRSLADDDLKRIHGVGPKIEKLLKSMGITSFLQVANFTPEDIETVTLALDAFPGRIERDDWVGSADALYRDKYESDD